MNVLLFPAIQQTGIFSVGWQSGFEKDNSELKTVCSTGETNENHGRGSHDVYDRPPMVGLIQ